MKPRCSPRATRCRPIRGRRGAVRSEHASPAAPLPIALLGSFDEAIALVSETAEREIRFLI